MWKSAFSSAFAIILAVGCLAGQPAVADDLEVREGCTVFLTRDEDGSFSGSTREKECTSTLREASYATSEIVITTDGVASWDRGYDADDQQVWGAVKAGYVFLRTAPEKP